VKGGIISTGSSVEIEKSRTFILNRMHERDDSKVRLLIIEMEERRRKISRDSLLVSHSRVHGPMSGREQKK
jgi:protein subunit release factor B